MVRVELAARIKGLEEEGGIQDAAEFFTQLDKFTQAITGIIDIKILKTRLSPFQKCGGLRICQRHELRYTD